MKRRNRTLPLASIKAEGMAQPPVNLPGSDIRYPRLQQQSSEQRDVYVCPEGKLLGYDCRHTKGKGFAYYRYAKAAHASRSAVRRIKSEAVR